MVMREINIFQLLLLFVPCVLSGIARTNNGIRGMPPGFDEWCSAYCNTHSSCVEVFGDDHLDLQLKVHYSMFDGPGEHLLNGIGLGDTISRQSFETQFILDIAATLRVSPCKIYVLDVAPPNSDASLWDVDNVIITFRLFSIEVEKVKILTQQAQDHESSLYQGQVTKAVDDSFGVVVLKWDYSLRIMTAIEIIGHDQVRLFENNDYVLNQGSERWCEDSLNNETSYCEFENYFREDLSLALQCSATNVELLFIKPSGEGSVFMTFRLIPPESLYFYNTSWVESKANLLVVFIQDYESRLYNGNVTFRVDQSWGLSGLTAYERTSSLRLNRSVRSSSPSPYERCKDTQRCSRGWTQFDSSASSSIYTMQRFAGGRHSQIPLFADFEDWRQGTQGWKRMKDNFQVDSSSNLHAVGAHWSPLDFASLGPSVPSFNTTINSGLILNAQRKKIDLSRQNGWISDIKKYIDWINAEINTTSLDALTRSRKDIIAEMQRTLRDHEIFLEEEERKLQVLSNSQCTTTCELHFNTSSLQLDGTINGTASIGFTPDGTEVAVWTFDSIDLDKNVKIHLTGQRAMALMSKSSAHIDTDFIAHPGTLGGFPGGYSIFRLKEHRLVSVCDEIPVLTRKGECLGDQGLSTMSSLKKSYNVNGPGSPSVRFHAFTVQTKSKILHEVQKITTDAAQGEIISGGFILHFNGYKTSFIRHDATAHELKLIVEDTLNAAKINSLEHISRTDTVSGIGRVGVSRFSVGSSGGYEWRITFLTAVGNIGDVDSGPLTITNKLKGDGVTAKIHTLTDGISIGGTFDMNLFGYKTGPLDHDISAHNMESILKTKISAIVDATVTRSGIQPNCNDGFCRNGPDASGGYLWHVSIITKFDNISPYSPTATDFDTEGPVTKMNVTNDLTGCVTSVCPNVTISLNRHTPFSLSFGGGGGSFGGHGGDGFSYVPKSMAYGDELISNLHGGSGGALGFSEPNDVNMVGIPTKVRGGSGGGAIEVIALTDLVLGPSAHLSANGEHGWSGFMTAGGGGSGGSILLSSGGTVRLDGKLSARGGDGGTPSKASGPRYNGSGGGGGRIAIYGESLGAKVKSSADISGGSCSARNQINCTGNVGSLYREKVIVQEYSIDRTTGAQDTNSSLLLHSFPSQTVRVVEENNVYRHLAGPSFTFGNEAQPEKISYYVKASCSRSKRPTEEWEALLILGSSVSNSTITKVLAISFGADLRHGFISKGGSARVNNRQRLKRFHGEPHFDHWYKIDIHLDWNNKSYDLFLDDHIVVHGSTIEIASIDFLSISSHASNVDVWFDEIFVGEDTTMGFQCPLLGRDQEMKVLVGGNRGWRSEDMGPTTSLHDMKRHESHVSNRQLYSRSDNGGIVPNDGMGHRGFTSDIKHLPIEGVSNSHKIKMRPGTISALDQEGIQMHIWYGEHNINGDASDGGVGACSTTDFIRWKNEGIMIHNLNITDMVHGSQGPFHIEYPKVIFNKDTKKYVMWMIIDNQNRSLAMAGVAESDYSNGPFTFVRSFYPDGNKTRDQTLFQDNNGEAYLIRTFYETIDFILPSAQMQPTWESVKNEDGSTNFALTYHRAKYEEGYDNFHDIYVQRWRGEDKPWQVICVDRITNTEREVPYGAKGDELCSGPFEFKKVIGQGDPNYMGTKNGIQSRFLDPRDPKNNMWMPDSVPGVQAQLWESNYESGKCGKRLAHERYQTYDHKLAERERYDRSNCSNIVDNPIHPTLPDKLDGRSRVVEKRRAKFIAVSKLTSDFLDTSGTMTKIEGELEDGADLSFLVNQAKASFDWKNGEDIQTPQEVLRTSYDGHKRFQQYSKHYNDRAFYSIQCIIDGDCPVNFRDQVDKETINSLI